MKAQTNKLQIKILLQEKLRRLDADNKIKNLSEAEKFIRTNIEEGIGDPKEEQKKLELIAKDAIKLGAEKAKLEQAIRKLHEPEKPKQGFICNEYE